MTGPLLEIRRLTKRFGSICVLQDCDLSFRAGEIHALLGANGAGKSTLVRIIAGLLRPSAGEMRLSGEAYLPHSKQDAESHGVEIVQQELNLVPTLSVAENLFLSRLPARLGLIRRQEMHQRARRALDRVGLTELAPETPVSALGVGNQQMVEIATALDRRCRLLILDEPTAALTDAETETLFAWLDRLRAQGVGIVYISHRLDEVARLADCVSVLRDGRVVGSGKATELETAAVVKLMSGEAAAQHQHSHQSYVRNVPALRLEDLSGGPVRGVSLEAYRGERLGIAGLVGSGRTELLRLMFGADEATSGHVFLGQSSQPRRFRRPAEAVAAGLAMITEDRKQNGLLLSQSIRLNTALASMWSRFSNCGLIRQRTEKEVVNAGCDSLNVRRQSIEQKVATLSGGNQQKVAIAKWLIRQADVFLFDEPTRGIDVQARQRIYRLIQDLAREGKGIVIVSSDLEELLEICDRIAVMSNGRLVEILARPDWSRQRLMQAAFAGYRSRSSTACTATE